MPPLVSILIPCYNAAPWLAATLESALAQTHPRTEIILVDDGSRDDSLALARTFEPRGVRVIAQKNSGAGAARNHALRESRGDFLQFLDADDLLSPDKISAQLAHLATRPPGQVATCAWGRFDHDPARANFADTAVFRDFAPLDFLLLAANENYMMHPAAWLVPRAIADRAGPWDETRSSNDDGEYFARVMLASAGLAFTPGARTYYRDHTSGSLRRTTSDVIRQGLFHSTQRLDAHLLAAEDSPRTRRAVANIYQRTIYYIYPGTPALVRAAEARIRALGGSSVPPPMGSRTALLARLLGWKNAFRLRALLG